MFDLTANSKCYGNNGQFIAELTGREKKWIFERTFDGRKSGSTTEHTIDTPGLFEACDLDRKGNKDYRYRLYVMAGDKLVRFRIEKEDAMTIAKAMDDGRKLDEIVLAEASDAPEAYEGHVWSIVSAAESKKAKAAASIDEAADRCWAILMGLPPADVKKVLAKVRDKASPNALETP